MSTYLARVRHDGSIRIHRIDQPEPLAAVTLPPDGTSLRRALREAGWQPTGQRAPGGGWDSIYVERLARAAPPRDRNGEDPAAARDRRRQPGRSRTPARRASAAGHPPTEEPTPMDERAWRFSERFRKVSNRYPLRVAEAYHHHLDPAMADSDEQVAATVAAWERRNGMPVRNWAAIGAEERTNGVPILDWRRFQDET
jgi:hypothetical protein